MLLFERRICIVKVARHVTGAAETMPKDKEPPQKSLKERLEELAQDLLDALESLVAPQPALVPAPARGRGRPYRR